MHVNVHKMDKMLRPVHITSWYPNPNGSHFGLQPSSIHTMTGLGDKMVWVVTYLHRPICSGCSAKWRHWRQWNIRRSLRWPHWYFSRSQSPALKTAVFPVHPFLARQHVSLLAVSYPLLCVEISHRCRRLSNKNEGGLFMLSCIFFAASFFFFHLLPQVVQEMISISSPPKPEKYACLQLVIRVSLGFLGDRALSAMSDHESKDLTCFEVLTFWQRQNAEEWRTGL